MATFTETFTCEHNRLYRITFERSNYGAFPKLVKVERRQTNGRDVFWTLHRVSCHGNLPGFVQMQIDEYKHIVRYAKA